MKVRYKITFEFERDVHKRHYLSPELRGNPATPQEVEENVTFEDIQRIDTEFVEETYEWIEFWDVGEPVIEMQEVVDTNKD